MSHFHITIKKKGLDQYQVVVKALLWHNYAFSRPQQHDWTGGNPQYFTKNPFLWGLRDLNQQTFHSDYLDTYKEHTKRE